MNASENDLLIPSRLQPGHTIGVVAPAGPFERTLFEQGLRILESMGFRVFVPRDILSKKGYLAGSDTHRANMINQMFADPSIQGIVCARGGFGSIRTLPRLDFDLIRRHPKIFVGFSDISALLAAIHTHCHLVTFHGPVVTTFAGASEQTRACFLQAVSSAREIEIKLEDAKTIRSGSVSGPVCGGNLTTLNHLIGTPFAPDLKGRILFLEDCSEATYRIDRMLFQMKMAGCFDELAGLILGTFTDCGPLENIYKVVANIFRDDDIAILAGLNAGHSKDNRTLPIGLKATLDAEKHVLTYHRAATIDSLSDLC